MKDFLRDSLPFILFFYSQCLLIIGIAQLAAVIAGTSLGIDIIIYLFVLPTSCLIIFLLFRYYKMRKFYRGFHQTSDSLPESPNKLLENVTAQYDLQTKHYEEEIHQLEQQKQLEFNFMQQWVHQMKTPVSVMHLTLQKEKDNLPEDFLHSMQEELERLQQGLDLALYQSRLQKFNRDFYVQQVSLNSLIKEVIKEFKSSFIRNNVFPKVTIDENLMIATDPKWFRFVLTQIISNAIKYSKESSNTIYFKALDEHKSLALNIRDTGHGIPAQDMSRMFDPFFTGINGRTFRESTGMGLYLSKEICENLGHDLKISSEKNVGTSVSIIIEKA